MIELEQRGEVAVLTLAHGKVNALDLDLLLALEREVGQLRDSALVLTGAGSSFCAGVDLRAVLDGSPAETRTFLSALSAAVLALFRHPRPVVAAVNGHAIAGGCVLAAAADLRLMSAGTMGLPELRVGVSFPTAALEVVRHAVGAHAQRLVLGADLIDAERALGIGLVDEVCSAEQLLDRAVDVARRLAAVPIQSYALAKRQLHAPAERAIARRTGSEDTEMARHWCSEEGRAAIGAFLAGLSRRDR